MSMGDSDLPTTDSDLPQLSSGTDGMEEELKGDDAPGKV